MNSDVFIDSQDDEYSEDIKLEFHKLLTNANLRSSIILNFVNKQDIWVKRNW